MLRIVIFVCNVVFHRLSVAVFYLSNLSVAVLVEEPSTAMIFVHSN
jgi:hypothetical protein